MPEMALIVPKLAKNRAINGTPPHPRFGSCLSLKTKIKEI